MFKSIVVAVLFSLFASLTAFAGEPANSGNAVASGGQSNIGDNATSGPAQGQRRSFSQEAATECGMAYSEKGKPSRKSLEFKAKIDRFKLVNEGSTYMTLHTTTTLSTNRSYFKRSKSEDAPAIVRELLKVDGITSVNIVDAYTIAIDHGALFEKEELMYNICSRLKTNNW